jgi:hypothetical protein
VRLCCTEDADSSRWSTKAQPNGPLALPVDDPPMVKLQRKLKPIKVPAS